MVFGMLHDIFVISALLLLLVIGFGVAFQVLLQPMDTPVYNFTITRIMIMRSYWIMFSESFNEQVDAFVEENPNRTASIVVALILESIFVLITVLLLFNVLVAMFMYVKI